MTNMNNNIRLQYRVIGIFTLLVMVVFAACSPASVQESDLELTNSPEAATSTVTQTPEPTATATITPTPTLTSTATKTPYTGPPPELPVTFSTTNINDTSNVKPVTYIDDICTAIANQLDPEKSQPGTVVMPVMYHSVTANDHDITDYMHVHYKEMTDFLEKARDLGFQTITIKELIGFLENNDPIPQYSLLLIVDDRRPGVVRQAFIPFMETYGWTVTLGWLIGDTDIRPASVIDEYPNETFNSLWEQMEAYNETGYLDIQSHGYVHNIPAYEYAPDDFLYHELLDSRTEIQNHFYCKGMEICDTEEPLAYIWPGGGFTAHAIEVAEEVGYKVGFTINPRGPIMFNWIPQAEKVDPASPSWIAEIPAGNPLFTLPRYWSYDAIHRIDEVVEISEDAVSYFESIRPQLELYFDVNCSQ